MEKTQVTDPDSMFRNRQRKIAGKKRTAAALSVLIALMCVTGALYACGKKNSGASGEPAVSQGDASGSGFEKIEGNAAGTAQADVPADSILLFKDDPGLKRLMEDMKAGDIPVDCNVLYDTMGSRPDVTVRDAAKIREIYDCLSRMKVGQKSNNSVTDSYHHVTFHLRNDSYVSCYFEGENLLSWGQEKYEVSGGDALWSCIMEMQDDVMADEQKKADAEAEKAAAAASAEKAKELAAEEEEEEEDSAEEADTADSAKKAASEKTSEEESKAGVKKTVTKKSTIKKGGSGEDSAEKAEKKSEAEKKVETKKKAESKQKTETEEKPAGTNTGLDKLPSKQEDVKKPAEQKKDTGKDKPAVKETEKEQEKPAEQEKEEKPSAQDNEKEKPAGQENDNEKEKPAEQEQENGEEQSAEENPEDKEEQPAEQDAEDGEEQPAEQDPENGEEQSDGQENEEDQPAEHAAEPAEMEESSDKKEGIEELPVEHPEEELPGADTEEEEESEEDSKEEKDGLQEQDIDTEKTEGPVQDAAALDTAAIDAAYTEIIRAYSAVLAQDPETFLQAYESGVYSEGAEPAETPESAEDAELIADAVDGRLNYEMIQEALARPDANGVYYGLRDYNSDGTPELVIALGTEEFKHIWAGYTFDGTKAVPLFTGNTRLSYRIDLFTLPDNSFLIHGSGGAMAGRDTICRIADNRSGLEILAEYDYDEQANGNMDHIGVSETLTDEEFQERYWANIVEAAKGAAFYRLAEDASVKTAEQAPAAAAEE